MSVGLERTSEKRGEEKERGGVRTKWVSGGR